jgi:hypothetical protein
MNRTSVVVGVLTVLSWACADNSVSGEVAGVSLDAAESVAVLERTTHPRQDGGTDHLVSLFVGLTDQAGFCDRLTRNVLAPEGRILAFRLLRTGDEADVALSPGDYALMKVDPQEAASMEALRNASKAGVVVGGVLTASDAQCEDRLTAAQSVASSGQVSIEVLDETHVAGEFDLTFPGGERLTGRFDAPFCLFTKSDQPAACGR